MDTYLACTAGCRGASSTLALPVLIPLMWLLTTVGLSQFGGWRKLARYYRRPPFVVPASEAFANHVALGSVNYNNAVFVGVSTNGLFLRMLFVFGLGHPKLLVPWSDVRFLHTRNFLFMQRDVYSLGQLEPVQFAVNAKSRAGKLVASYVNGPALNSR